MSAPSDQQQTLSEQIERLHGRIAAMNAPDTTTTHEELLAELASAHEELLVADEEVRSQQEELDRLIAARGDSRRAVERFLSLLPAAVVMTDAAGSITFANDAATAFLGVAGDRLAGKPLVAFVDPSDRRAVRDMLSAATSGEAASLRRVVTIHTRVGSQVTVELAATVEAVGRSPETRVTWALVSDHTKRADSPHASVAQALLEMAQLPVATTDRSEILKTVTVICSRAFDFPVAASISVGAPVAPELTATESRLAQVVDGAQMMAGEGPCQEAWASQMTVRSADLRADERWPRLAPRLDGVAVRAGVASPVRAPGPAGCLNLYSDDDRLVEAAHVRTAEMLAAAVSAVLYENDLKGELATAADQLRTALESRAVIDQAKGIVMARERCGPEEAFRLLVQLSSRQNVKLRVLAARLVQEVARS